MIHYDDDRELREAMHGKLADYLQRHVGRGLAYDATDEKELWHDFIETVPLDGTKKKAKMRFVRKRFPFYHRKGGTSARGLVNWMGEATRKALGLDNPIPLEKLEGELERIKTIWEKGGKKGDGWILASYPRLDWIEGVHKCLHIWSISYVMFPDVASYITEDYLRCRTQDAILEVSRALHCHPALALAFLLCDIPVHQDMVTVVIDSELSVDYSVSVYIGQPETPIWIINRMYSFARRIALGLKRGWVSELAKPRATTVRMSTLIDFAHRNKTLSWKERYKKWGKEYPRWKYSDENSMRTVYYRKKPKIGKKKL